jgi:hypothetical protein
MARSLDDDAPSRTRAADERIYEGMSNLVLNAQEGLTRRRRLDRIERVAWAVGFLSLSVAVIGVVVVGDPSRFAVGALICGSVLLLSLLTVLATHIVGRGVPTRQRAEAELASAQETLWKRKVDLRPALDKRRQLYREEVATIIEHYQEDSRKYRRIHNRLQGLIMVGSAATTTIAALDTGRELTWQSLTLTLISFAITVSAMFTGYYKFRERSYFLQQTADAIEEEANAVTLGIGPYRDFDPGQEHEALRGRFVR